MTLNSALAFTSQVLRMHECTTMQGWADNAKRAYARFPSPRLILVTILRLFTVHIQYVWLLSVSPYEFCKPLWRAVTSEILYPGLVLHLHITPSHLGAESPQELGSVTCRWCFSKTSISSVGIVWEPLPQTLAVASTFWPAWAMCERGIHTYTQEKHSYTENQNK